MTIEGYALNFINFGRSAAEQSLRYVVNCFIHYDPDCKPYLQTTYQRRSQPLWMRNSFELTALFATSVLVESMEFQFANQIQNQTVITMSPLRENCLSFQDCQSCQDSVGMIPCQWSARGCQALQVVYDRSRFFTNQSAEKAINRCRSTGADQSAGPHTMINWGMAEFDQHIYDGT